MIDVRVPQAPVGTDDDGRRIVDVHPVRDPRWQAFVDSRDDATIFHDASWFEVLEQTYPYRPAALACEAADGSLVGVLPLFEKPSLLAGRHLSSLPHTPIAGPIAADRNALHGLVSAAVDRLQGSSCRWLQLKVASQQLTGMVDGLVGSDWEPTFVLELPDQPEQLRFGDSRNNARIRWAVRAAHRRGVGIRRASSRSDLKAWYRLYLDTMRSHAVPPRSFRHFEAMWEILGPVGKMWLLLAELRNGRETELLAGTVFVRRGPIVSSLFSGSRRDALHLRPNDALQWHAINEACKQGARVFDFGRAAEGNRGLVNFKEKWGAEPCMQYRYHFPRAREMERTTLGEGRRLRRMGERVWRSVPLSVTAALGAAAYRRL